MSQQPARISQIDHSCRYYLYYHLLYYATAWHWRTTGVMTSVSKGSAFAAMLPRAALILAVLSVLLAVYWQTSSDASLIQMFVLPFRTLFNNPPPGGRHQPSWPPAARTGGGWSASDRVRVWRDAKAGHHAAHVGYFGEPLDDHQVRYGYDEDQSAAQHTQVDQGAHEVGYLLVGDTASKEAKKTDDHALEALSSVHLALDFVAKGKADKARRLFEHALVLAPQHPDVLTEYGYFMEHYHEHVHDGLLRAENMYAKALTYNPFHEGALKNRERTAPLVEEIDNRMLDVIDEKRRYFLNVPRNNAALRRAMKDAYFLHVYHTVAIEGNTMSLIQTRSILETHLAVHGKSVMEHNEIIGMDAALRYLNQTLVHRIGNIDIDDIKDIHRRVLGYVDPMQAGVFRTTQVYVGSFTPVDPSQVRQEMVEFLAWLNSDDALSLHPVEMAALAHYKLAFIHPFIDGNGRTARLLMNLILMQAGFPPVIIRVEDRLHYYETLKEANDGDLRPFIRLIATCTGRTLDSYLKAVAVQLPRTDSAKATDKRLTTAPSSCATGDADDDRRHVETPAAGCQ